MKLKTIYMRTLTAIVQHGYLTKAIGTSKYIAEKGSGHLVKEIQLSPNFPFGSITYATKMEF